MPRIEPLPVDAWSDDYRAVYTTHELSPVELVDGLLHRIESIDPVLNSFITVTAEAARTAALKWLKLVDDGDYARERFATTHFFNPVLYTQMVEVVKGDLLEPSSLRAAFEGAHGAFLVTNFWDPTQMPKETEIGNAVVKEARAAGVQHRRAACLSPAA